MIPKQLIDISPHRLPGIIQSCHMKIKNRKMKICDRVRNQQFNKELKNYARCLINSQKRSRYN